MAPRISGTLSAILALPLAASLLASGCSKSSSDSSDLNNCTPPSGSPWVPNVPGVSNTNHNAAISVTTSTFTQTAQLNGWEDPMAGARLVTVTIPMQNDPGPLGSLALSAQVTGVPSALQGAFHPMLVSLNDGTHEYINLAMAGSGTDCAVSGMNGSQCLISAPSAYPDVDRWFDHQLRYGGPGTAASASDNESMNVFPTCNWSGGSSGSASSPDCAFNTTFFPASPTPKRLKFGAGVNYTAKYFVIADPFAGGADSNGDPLTYGTIPMGYQATLTVTAIYKTNPGTTLGGAVDLNVILVGSQNVNDSRTPKGQQNLDLLMQSLVSVYGQTATDPASTSSYSPSVKIGNINVIEWGCDAGGEAYATANPDDAGAVLQAGSAALPASLAGKAINIFLVSQFTDAEVLGVDGSIGGTYLNGTPSSGMLVATLGKLGSYNPGCTLSSCPVTSQEQDFVQMGPTIAHEMGHFFGLNHTSERAGTQHDPILDTAMHTATYDFHNGMGAIIQQDVVQQNDTNVYSLTGKTCHQACPSYNSGVFHPDQALQFCPAAFECGFNQLMWWTGKYYSNDNSTGDGNIISLDSSYVINYNPFVY